MEESKSNTNRRRPREDDDEKEEEDEIEQLSAREKWLLGSRRAQKRLRKSLEQNSSRNSTPSRRRLRATISKAIPKSLPKSMMFGKKKAMAAATTAGDKDKSQHAPPTRSFDNKDDIDDKRRDDSSSRDHENNNTLASSQKENVRAVGNRLFTARPTTETGQWTLAQRRENKEEDKYRPLRTFAKRAHRLQAAKIPFCNISYFQVPQEDDKVFALVEGIVVDQELTYRERPKLSKDRAHFLELCPDTTVQPGKWRAQLLEHHHQDDGATKIVKSLHYRSHARQGWKGRRIALRHDSYFGADFSEKVETTTVDVKGTRLATLQRDGKLATLEERQAFVTSIAIIPSTGFSSEDERQELETSVTRVIYQNLIRLHAPTEQSSPSSSSSNAACELQQRGLLTVPALDVADGATEESPGAKAAAIVCQFPVAESAYDICMFRDKITGNIVGLDLTFRKDDDDSPVLSRTSTPKPSNMFTLAEARLGDHDMDTNSMDRMDLVFHPASSNHSPKRLARTSSTTKDKLYDPSQDEDGGFNSEDGMNPLEDDEEEDAGYYGDGHCDREKARSGGGEPESIHKAATSFASPKASPAHDHGPRTQEHSVTTGTQDSWASESAATAPLGTLHMLGETRKTNTVLQHDDGNKRTSTVNNPNSQHTVSRKMSETWGTPDSVRHDASLAHGQVSSSRPQTQVTTGANKDFSTRKTAALASKPASAKLTLALQNGDTTSHPLPDNKPTTDGAHSMNAIIADARGAGPRKSSIYVTHGTIPLETLTNRHTSGLKAPPVVGAEASGATKQQCLSGSGALCHAGAGLSPKDNEDDFPIVGEEQANILDLSPALEIEPTQLWPTSDHHQSQKTAGHWTAHLIQWMVFAMVVLVGLLLFAQLFSQLVHFHNLDPELAGHRTGTWTGGIVSLKGARSGTLLDEKMNGTGPVKLG